MCTICDSTNINTIIEFVPHVSVDGFNGGSDSYVEFRDTLEVEVYVFFYLIEQHSKVLLHTLQVLYMCTLCDYMKYLHDNRVRSKLSVACQR